MTSAGPTDDAASFKSSHLSRDSQHSKSTSSRKHRWKCLSWQKAPSSVHWSDVKLLHRTSTVEKNGIITFVNVCNFCNCSQTAHASSWPSFWSQNGRHISCDLQTVAREQSGLCMGGCGAWTYGSPTGIMMQFTFWLHAPSCDHDTIKHMLPISAGGPPEV